MTTNAPSGTAAANDKVLDDRLPVEWYDEVTPTPNDSDLVRGLIAAESLVLVWGPPKSRKSFVALDLALHIAAGRPWCGCEVRAGTVVYIAAQSGRSVKRRLAAARGKFGDGKIPLAVVSRAVTLLDERELSKLEITLRDIEQQRGPIVAIFVDSLSRTAAGMDENASGEMTGYIKVLDRLRETFGATVVVVHESGKSHWRGARGHSALVAAVDTGIEVGDGEIVFELQRDRPAGDRFEFDLGPVGVREADRAACWFVQVRAEPEHRDPDLHQVEAGNERPGPVALLAALNGMSGRRR